MQVHRLLKHSFDLIQSADAFVEPVLVSGDFTSHAKSYSNWWDRLHQWSLSDRYQKAASGVPEIEISCYFNHLLILSFRFFSYLRASVSAHENRYLYTFLTTWHKLLIAVNLSIVAVCRQVRRIDTVNVGDRAALSTGGWWNTWFVHDRSHPFLWSQPHLRLRFRYSTAMTGIVILAIVVGHRSSIRYVCR